MPLDLFLDLIFTFLYKPLNEACIILLVLDMVLLFFNHSLGPELFLLEIHNSMEFSIFGSITGSKFLIKWLLRWRHHGSQSPINVKLGPCQKLVEPEEKILSSFGTHVNNRIRFLFGDLEFPPGKIFGKLLPVINFLIFSLAVVVSENIQFFPVIRETSG